MGQEQCWDVASLPHKPTTLRSAASIARCLGTSPVSKMSTAVSCPIPPRQDVSCPDLQEHTISTPLHPSLASRTPSFDLSKVAHLVVCTVLYYTVL